MKVIIIKNFKEYKVNEIIEVSDGYAKNFLIKNGYAQPINKQTLANLDRVKENIKKDYEEQVKLANDKKQEIEKITLNFSLKANGNIVHGSITTTAIEKELLKHNIKLPKNSIEVVTLNTFGQHYVTIKLHDAVKAMLKIIITENK